MNEEELPLSVENLFKKYSSKSDYAVKDLSFVAKKGEIVGLLGANGAGKSTILKCATGMIAPSSGDVFICGKSISKKPIAAKKHLSFVTDNHSVFSKMTGRQYLDFMFDVFNIPSEGRDDTVKNLDGYFHLGADINRLIAGYSHGMKQKICMMGSLVHSPDLWILDEPMVGLDPRTQRAVMDFMRGYAAKGKTILFSSHDLDAVKKVCSRAVIINRGVKTSDIYIADAGDKIDKLYDYDYDDDISSK